MALTNVLLSTLEILAILPVGYLCLVVFNKDSAIPYSLSLGIYTVVFTVLSAIGGYIRIAFNLNINHIILAITVPMLIYPLLTIKGNKFKVLYVFTSGGAISSSLRLYGYLLESYLDSSKGFLDIQTWGLMLRWGLTVSVFFLIVFSLKKIRWLMKCENIDNLWKYLWLMPLVFDAANMTTVPHEYSLMQLGRIAQIYITIVSTLAIMQLVFHVMLYAIAKTITEKSQLDKQAQMLSVQASQYEDLQRHIEATSKLRHDFKHTARTAVELARKGEHDALIELLSDYYIVTANTDKRSVFTKNSSLNALICYYYEQALTKNIFCNWQINLPEKLGVDDIDLFGIFGNLLENAIHASETEIADNRYINLTADMEDNGDIYIVTTNGFDGNIEKDRGKYLSTKKGGSGIGIKSIESTVKRYNGCVKFYNDPKTFYADIMIRQK